MQTECARGMYVNIHKKIFFMTTIIIVVVGLFWLSRGKEISPDAEEPFVNVYNWYGMITPDILREFETETGITVRYDLYDNNEMVEAKLFSGNSGYDIIFPSASPYVARHIEAGLYQKIDKTLVPNLRFLDPIIAAQMATVDPHLDYSVPYYWGTFGFAYVEEIILKRLPHAPTQSYAMLFDPNVVKHFQEDGVSLLDEAVDVYPAMLVYLGKDSQSTDEGELRQAQEELLKIRPYIKRFSSSRFVNELVGGETCLAQAWSGEAQLAQQRAQEVGKNIHIRYVVPKEGGTLWIDAMVIPKGAPHPKAAHQFINFMMKPEICARIANAIQLAIANTAALPLIDAQIREDKTIYPDMETMAKLKLDRPQHIQYERLRTRFWTQMRLRTAQH